MEPKAYITDEKAKGIWDLVRIQKPLVFHITNFVAMPEQAHITLAIGASPIMSLSIDEAKDMCGIASALLINIGTPSTKQLAMMKVALHTANQNNIPVLLDPVGYGATPFRNEIVNELLRSGKFAVIKGNYGEIMALAGASGTTRGVDSVSDNRKNIQEAMKHLLSLYDSIVVATGEEDFIANKKEMLSLQGGSKKFREITGSGCMCGSIISSLLGTKEDPFQASLFGVAGMKLAGKRAGKKCKGPGSFRMQLFDELSNLSGDEIVKEIEVILWT